MTSLPHLDAVLSEVVHVDAPAYGPDCPGVRGDTRTPEFGEWMRGVWASVTNPHRDGMYVCTVVRTGRLNPGRFYRLTDGRGKFWMYPPEATVFLCAPILEPTP